MAAIHRYVIIQTVKTTVRSTSPENALEALSTVQTINLDDSAPQSHDIISRSRVVEIDISEEY